MSNSFFSKDRERDGGREGDEERDEPLLPQHRNSVHLRTLSPTTSSSRSQKTTSPSPPPSFYRDRISSSERPFSLSPSPDSTRERRIQFAQPPPPLASSILPPQHRNSHSRGAGVGKGGGFRAGMGNDPLLVLERKSRALQRELQGLLDAQASGLRQGFGGGGKENESYGSEGSGSRTPTLSVRSSSGHSGGRREGGSGGGVIPVRQPRKKVVSLRGARRGLGRDMGELIVVKEEEGAVLQGEIGRREEVLGRVRGWEGRIEEGRRMVDSYSFTSTNNAGEEDREVQELRTEEKAVDAEIRELEDRLAQMRARKKWLGERVREGENRREAKLSSYKGALREVEGEVREFLRRPGVPVSVVMGEERGFEDLPVGRRTLGIAAEWWGRELSVLEKKKKEVEVEKVALVEGREMWGVVSGVVTEFEDRLRVQMREGKQQSLQDLAGQVEKMRDVIRTLEREFQKAEEKGYNLLICAIGAELDAFKEGEGILREALGTVQGQDGEGGEGGEGGEVEREDSFHSTDSGLNTLKELNGAVQGDGSRDGESEDDGPDLAELLVDRGGRREEEDVD